MLSIQSYVSLRSYNTFGIDVKARYFVEIGREEELQTLLQLTEFLDVPKLILGGGSNLLLTRDFDGLVIHVVIKGIQRVREDSKHVFLKAGAGVTWHDLVLYTIEQGYAGLENLSLIPGTVGAAPMQNIGAYGVELERFFEELEAVHVRTGETRIFTYADCCFGYRESIFKHDLKGEYIITRVTFRLQKEPVFYITYGSIRETLAEMGSAENQLTIKAVSDAVIHIRKSKLPDPAVVGNAGSFFKNPELPKEQFARLKADYPDLPGYSVGDSIGGGATVKVPAGWLIEQCGWKGKRVGNAGVHSKQALVLVNYGGATGEEIVSLAQKVRKSVEDKFGVTLHTEVNIV